MGDLLSSGVQVARHDITHHASDTRGAVATDNRTLRWCLPWAGALYQQFVHGRECPFEAATSNRCLGLPDEHIWLQSKIRLKINHWRSSPEPPELAGFYVDSVKF